MKYIVALIVLSVFLMGGLTPSGGLDFPITLAAQAGGKAASAIPTGDAGRGRVVFEKRCTGCHAMEEDREGPRLHGVYGRKAGSEPGYDYSAGLKNSGIIWNEDSLERWLSDPDLVVPDNNMGFRLPKAQERSDLIAYLKSLREAR